MRPDHWRFAQFGSTDGMSDAILFDRDEVERLDDLDERPKRLGRGKLVWVGRRPRLRGGRAPSRGDIRAPGRGTRART